MGNSGVFCMLITSKSKCLLDVVSKVVKKFKFCPEQESFNEERVLWEQGVVWQLCYGGIVF